MAHDARESSSLASPTTLNTSSGPFLDPDARKAGRPCSATIASTVSLAQSAQPSALTGSPAQHWLFRPARTLPGWVRSFDVPDDDEHDPTTSLLPTEIDDAIVAQHNHSPYDKSKPNRDGKGYDIGHPDPKTGLRESRWTRFARSVAYPHADSGAEEKRVSFEWLNTNLGDYSQPWGVSSNGSDAELGRASWKARKRSCVKRFQMNLLQSPIVPLILRATVWIFSLCALALGGSINHMGHRDRQVQGPSAVMAIVVDAVALVYLVYITYDEYTGKPLGLRSPKAKMRLILLDIFFIVFDSANLSLAFAELGDLRGPCTDAVINNELDERNSAICQRQTALASVLLVALIAWLLTFCISVFRLVERVTK
ncbi:hypothetical protein BGW36DRAFT_426160 [Talaromyces proteolyticus]|uniref:Regulator of phospholipase D SRF1 n=1 Tax=Talaromyces proteolyticus TaxID=1131652 RepID=A0AAD4KSP0_9EURO|nr:uncharacterized protein BGW36DRAFT_426160 [Talaromyces proteolyticus]KAH8698453.1 hypothetical protein BGW36DRAFT_426160 [Talaromyces proteolyticus]